MSVPLRPEWDLFHPPPDPPTGPPTDVAKFASGAAAYAAWKATHEGWLVWRYVERTALDQAAAGQQRISTRTIVAEARDRFTVDGHHVSINDHYTALLADDLLARHPHLEDRIERRKRNPKEADS